MVHGIRKEDGLVLVGERAWHGLGTVVERGLGVREGFHKAVPWRPVTCPVWWGPDGSDLVPDAVGIKAVYPEGPSRYLATVSAGYSLVDHDAFLDLAEAAERDGVTLETVGTTHGGRKLFLLLRLGSYGVGLNREDSTSTYLALLNSFDGSTALRGFGTEVRVVCANTYAASLGAADAAAVGFRIQHTGDLTARLEAARTAIAAGRLQLATLEAEARALADIGMTAARVGEYYGRVAAVLFPAIATDCPTDAKEAAAWERQRERARATVTEWVREFEHERQRLVSGTLYAALESVTHWADHGRPRVTETAADRLLGRGAAIKFKAREVALALAR